MPVPAIDRKLKVNTAASGAGLLTTGGILTTIWSRPGMANFHAHRPSMIFLNAGVPQMNTNTDRITHGAQARTMLMRAAPASAATAAADVPLAAMSSIEVS